MAAIRQITQSGPAALKRLLPAARARTYAWVALVVVGGLAAAALGDVAVEAALKAGAFGSGYFDRSHRTNVPAAVGAIALLLLALGWTRMQARYDDRWFLRVARDAAAARLPAGIAATTTFALLVSVALERLEQSLGGGLPFGGLPLLGLGGLGVAAVFSLSAAVVVLSLGALMRSVVAACDLVARALHVALVWLLDVPGGAGPAASLRSAAEAGRVACALALSRAYGDRAPPGRSLAIP